MLPQKIFELYATNEDTLVWPEQRGTYIHTTVHTPCFHFWDPNFELATCSFLSLSLCAGTPQTAVGPTHREGHGQAVWQLPSSQQWHHHLWPVHSHWSPLRKDIPEK